MKKLLVIFFLACSSSGIAAQPEDAETLCPDIEQATATGAFKGLSRETFEDFICEVAKQTLRWPTNKTDWRKILRTQPCEQALQALIKRYDSDYPMLHGTPQGVAVSLNCPERRAPCSCYWHWGSDP